MAKKELYIGVMSGTSLDGVDVALCSIDKKGCVLLHAKEYPYPKKLRKEVLKLIQHATTLKELGSLDVKLGKLYAKTIQKFLKHFHINKKNITAIGLHGQTLWHEPKSKHPFSMQLGSPSVIAAKSSIPIVYDFRNNDIAYGGEGAPFAPLFHQFVFQNIEKSAVVNIGGMSNITLFEPTLQGWDIGCGNVLLDIHIQQTRNKPYDKNGSFAKKGDVNTQLLTHLLQDAYFAKQPPKSTGREYFNTQWLEKKLKKFSHLPHQDIQATLTELVAQTITDAIKNKNIKTLILCGGGAKNRFLRKRIQTLSNTHVIVSDTLGVSGDFLEAMLFAWLAYKRIHQHKLPLTTVTGARKNTHLGAILLP